MDPKELANTIILDRVDLLIDCYSSVYKAARGTSYKYWSEELIEQIESNYKKAKSMIRAVYDDYIAQVSARKSYKAFLDIFKHRPISGNDIKITFTDAEKELDKSLFDIYFSSAVAGIEEFKRKLSIQTSFSAADHYAIDYYKFLKTQRKDVLLDTDKKILSSIFNKANSEGLTKRETQKLIIDRFSDEEMTKARAQSIAVTETTASLNWAKYQSGVNSSIELVKMWLTAEDDLVRPSHLVLDHKVSNINDDFVTGDGNSCSYPGDARLPAGDVINCRCSFSMRPKEL